MLKITITIELITIGSLSWLFNCVKSFGSVKMIQKQDKTVEVVGDESGKTRDELKE